jgi:hypothetical protein
MNRIDEQHKSLAGSSAIQPPFQPDASNNMGQGQDDEMQKKLGRRLNMMM